MLKETYTSEAEALRAAQSEWQRIQRGRSSLNMTLAYGRPELLPESPVRLEGFKRNIDQQPWVVIEVKHDLSRAGYTTTLQCEVKT